MSPFWIALTQKGGAIITVNANAIAWIGADGSGGAALHFGDGPPLVVEDSPDAVCVTAQPSRASGKGPR